MDSAIRICLADDHPIVRDGLRKLLEAEEGFVVEGEAGSGDEALEIASTLAPDILLLDVVMPGLPALEVLRGLAARATSTRTILLTASIDRGDVIKALQLGARGLVMKDAATQSLMKAIRAVMTGQYWIGRDAVSGLVETLRTQMFSASEPQFGLTPRELEVIAAVTAGYTNKEIAQRYTLSEETVKHHLTRIFHKLGVSNRLELALFAISRHLIDRS